MGRSPKAAGPPVSYERHRGRPDGRRWLGPRWNWRCLGLLFEAETDGTVEEVLDECFLFEGGGLLSRTKDDN